HSPDTYPLSLHDALPISAQAASLDCDLFLVLGSSLVVYPAAGFPMLAKRNGATLAIVNREPTDQDAYADLVLHDEIGPVMAAVRSEEHTSELQSRENLVC